MMTKKPTAQIDLPALQSEWSAGVAMLKICTHFPSGSLVTAGILKPVMLISLTAQIYLWRCGLLRLDYSAA